MNMKKGNHRSSLCEFADRTQIDETCAMLHLQDRRKLEYRGGSDFAVRNSLYFLW